MKDMVAEGQSISFTLIEKAKDLFLNKSKSKKIEELEMKIANTEEVFNIFLLFNIV